MATHHREISESDFNQLAEGKKAFVDGYESDGYAELDIIVFCSMSSEGKPLVSKHKIIQVMGSNDVKAIRKNHVIAFVEEGR
ncbi:hypothetical protein ACQ676_002508 [Vibrio fluvialis]|nr:hypothetical protein [Vibrio fluvialis]